MSTSVRALLKRLISCSSSTCFDTDNSARLFSNRANSSLRRGLKLLKCLILNIWQFEVKLWDCSWCCRLVTSLYSLASTADFFNPSSSSRVLSHSTLSAAPAAWRIQRACWRFTTARSIEEFVFCHHQLSHAPTHVPNFKTCVKKKRYLACRALCVPGAFGSNAFSLGLAAASLAVFPSY